MQKRMATRLPTQRDWCEYSAQRGLTDHLRLCRREPAQLLAQLRPVVRDQAFASGFKEVLDALPKIGDEAATSARCFKHPRRRRKTAARHAFATDIQYCQGRCVEKIMITGINVTEIFDVRLLCANIFPAVSAQNEAHRGIEPSGFEKEFKHARFAIRQAIADEAEVSGKFPFSLHRVVCGGIERIINRYARACPQRRVAIDYRIAAAISKNNVIARDQRPKWILRILLYALESRGRIDIPERHSSVARPKREHRFFQQRIKHSNPAGFHQKVGFFRRRFDRGKHGVGIVDRINDALGVRRLCDIAMRLTLPRVGLVEFDPVTARMEGAQNTAIVRRRTVPVG